MENIVEKCLEDSGYNITIDFNAEQIEVFPPSPSKSSVVLSFEDVIYLYELIKGIDV